MSAANTGFRYLDNVSDRTNNFEALRYYFFLKIGELRGVKFGGEDPAFRNLFNLRKKLHHPR
jgi:hypothetical protein